jgi:VWFA-related protein
VVSLLHDLRNSCLAPLDLSLRRVRLGRLARYAAFLLACIAGFSVAASAQTQSNPPELPPDTPADTLHVNTRIVLTDVTVTDANGNPVRNLKRSDFHIFDDNHPQKLASFTEHVQSTAPEPVAAPSAPNTFSNNFLLHPPSTANVILIDSAQLGISGQMFLYQQLNKFVQRLPPSEPVAVFNRSGMNTILLQNFTADHTLLLTAIRKAIPRLRSPDAVYADDYSTLQQISLLLQQVPGRKNVLWFTGGFVPLLFMNDPDFPPMEPLYDLLEAERIAIYPIDARGLDVNPRFGEMSEQLMMQQDAEATGGEAFYNRNGIAQIASRTVSTDGNYYTLTYTPNDLRQDGRWHNVKVTLAGSGYHLSYRRGYYDDGANRPQPPIPQRKILTAQGKVSTAPDEQAEDSRPIIFQAALVPLTAASQTADSSMNLASIPAKRGHTTYSVHYMVPAAQINSAPKADGNRALSLAAAIVAFSDDGTPIGRTQERANFSMGPQFLHDHPDANLSFYQEINLPDGLNYLTVGVWDIRANRFGTIDLPLDVQKQPKPKKK